MNWRQEVMQGKEVRRWQVYRVKDVELSVAWHLVALWILVHPVDIYNNDLAFSVFCFTKDFGSAFFSNILTFYLVIGFLAFFSKNKS